MAVELVDLFHFSDPLALQPALGGQNRYLDDLTTYRAGQGLDRLWTDQPLQQDATKIQLAQNTREIDAGLRRGYPQSLGKTGLKMAAIGFDMSGMSRLAFLKNWPQLSKIILPIVQMMHSHFTKDYMAYHYKLSAREIDVLARTVMGLRPDEIAHKLSLGYRTVDKYIVSAKRKLGANSRDQTVARALHLLKI